MVLVEELPVWEGRAERGANRMSRSQWYIDEGRGEVEEEVKGEEGADVLQQTSRQSLGQRRVRRAENEDENQARTSARLLHSCSTFLNRLPVFFLIESELYQFSCGTN